VKLSRVKLSQLLGSVMALGRESDGQRSAYHEVKGEALNLKRSPEKHRFWVRADPLRSGAGHAGGAQETSTNRPPGVSDGIECRL
jgi:hypothetical protein